VNLPNASEILSRVAGNPWALAGTAVVGAALMLWRTVKVYRAQATASRGALDFTRLKNLSTEKIGKWLKQNLRGQDEAVDEIMRQLRSNIQLAKSGRCLGTFLLSGPTGTGKTFLAQLVGEALFPQSPPVLLRMNQYKNADDVFTLLGPPPGRPGFELGGALTRPVLENGFRVVILDELEKAHPDIFDCLYDILDTGSCREKSSGKMVDFSGCVFFATSNGAVDLLRATRARAGNGDRAVLDAAYRAAIGEGTKFNKAFIARWERVCFLDTLTDLHVAEVACLNLTKYWAQFGMNVVYASPKLILETVQRNKEFKDYGVRQLMGLIRMKSDSIVEKAKEEGRKDVSLDVLPNGEFCLKKGAVHAA
jgi:ATP-dependent Clp protease ATP-binding subunit ClpA